MRWLRPSSCVVRMTSATLVIGGALALGSARVSAQQPVDSSHATKRTAVAPFPLDSAGMSGFFGSMVPMQIRAATMTLEATWATLAKPESAAHLADFTKNYYDALMARGFTKDQALAIVMAVGIPHSTPGR